MGDPMGRAGVHLRRVRALDGLRGLAVVAVLLFHDERLRGGYLGVDLFFVLSGFLITSLLLVEFEDSGRIRLRRFYERRARRLLPALGLALLGVAFYAAVWARPLELPHIRRDGIGTLFYFQNWREILTKQNYWNLFTAPSPLQHAWSLSIEEQFYAIWPLIVIGVLAIRRSAGAVLAVTLTLGSGCAAFQLLAAQSGVDQRVLYYSTMSRAPALLMGAALAAIVAIRGPAATRRGRSALEVIAIAGAAYIAWEWGHQSGDGLSLYRGPLLLCGLAAAAIIAAAAHPKRGPLARALEVPPLVGLGLISYGLYLFHWPVYLVLNPARTGLSGWELLAERTGVSVAIALSSYYLIEQPIRHGALRPTRAVAALTTATALIATSLIVTTNVTHRSTTSVTIPNAGSRTPIPQSGTDLDHEFLPPGDWSRLTQRCHAEDPPPYLRPVGRTTAPKVLIAGDSVACFLGAALDIDQVKDSVVTLNRSRIGCVIVAPLRLDSSASEAVPACIDGEQPAIAAFDPDVSVLFAGGPEFVRYDIGGGGWVSPCDSSFDAWYEAGARQSIKELSANGATVVVVTIVHPPPDLPSLPKGAGRHVDCNNRSLRRAVASEPRARLLDLDAYVCPRGSCRDKIDGITLRPDGIHFLGKGATVIAEWMLPRVLALANLHQRR